MLSMGQGSPLRGSVRTSVLSDKTEEPLQIVPVPVVLAVHGTGGVRSSVNAHVLCETPVDDAVTKASGSTSSDESNWDTYFDDEGTPYFCHRVTGKTTWEKPS